MNKWSKLIGSAVLIAISSASCKDKNCTDPVPYIEFRTITNDPTSSVLTFYFKDCDGDIGYKTNVDTSKFNMFLTYYQKVNGVWEELVLPEPSRYRIPLVTSKANTTKLEGEIDVDLTVDMVSFRAIDTLKIGFYILDNADHQSNTQETNTIINN